MPDPRYREPVTSTGGEAAALTLLLIAVGLALAALVGVGLAAAVCGDGWVWPHGSTAIAHELAALLTGRPGHTIPSSRAHVPGAAIYLGVALSELAFVAAAVVSAWLVARCMRPSDNRRGMATRHEARRALGRHRLESARTIIRPDLTTPPQKDSS